MITKFNVSDNVLIRGEVIGITITTRGESYRVRTHSGISIEVPVDDAYGVEVLDDEQRS